MATGDHPDIPFVEARTADGGPAYTRGRPDGPPLWVVIHDMEFPERLDAAEWTAHYFSGPASAAGRSVSSHYTADADSIVQCVRLADTAWTVGNRPGNYRGINWELAGYASQTRAQWLDTFSHAMLTRIAEIIRRDLVTYGIPARTLTDEQVRGRAKGITSHWQLGRVFGGTDHTDPGPNFPWDVLLNLIKEETVALRDDLDGWYMMHRVKGQQDNADPIVIPPWPPPPATATDPGRKEPNLLAQELAAIKKLLTTTQPGPAGDASITGTFTGTATLGRPGAAEGTPPAVVSSAAEPA